jgi:predicted N-acetyltransferase YhbS
VLGDDDAATVQLLADCPHLVEAVGLLRWQEWGHAPEATSLQWWIATTIREAGRDELPLTLVALDGADEVIGAVGLNQFDIEERRDRSPWIIGMIVRPYGRRRGVGRTLLASLHTLALTRGLDRLWVATETAEPFYEACGYRPVEVVARVGRPPAHVLARELLST